MPLDASDMMVILKDRKNGLPPIITMIWQIKCEKSCKRIW
jgi:hypothetical protein